jgi:phosphoribosyl 1,2-cyclic phosphodiesterase
LLIVDFFDFDFVKYFCDHCQISRPMTSSSACGLLPRVSLLTLGTGKGISYVYDRVTSTSFLILVDEQPLLLVDCGGGVRAALKDAGFDRLPPWLFISHNHSDHAADLPVVLPCEPGLKIAGAPAVLERLRDHRMHEHMAWMRPEGLAQWIAATSPAATEPLAIDLGTADLRLTLHQAVHSELCYGFVLWRGSQPLLGYTCDSAFALPFYQALAVAPTMICDARLRGNPDHASFAEVAEWWATHRLEHAAPRFLFITGYGNWAHPPDRPPLPQLPAVRPYSPLHLWPLEPLELLATLARMWQTSSSQLGVFFGQQGALEWEWLGRRGIPCFGGARPGHPLCGAGGRAGGRSLGRRSAADRRRRPAAAAAAAAGV